MRNLAHCIQNLSLDVTAGAVISSAFVCQYFRVQPDWHIMLGLAIAIWLIYTIDHLRDAEKSSDETINPRHQFHRRNYRRIIAFAILVFIVGVINAFWLPITTIWYGLILGGFSGLYFIYLKFSKAHALKELFAAVIYSLGVFVTPLSLLEHWYWYHAIFFLLFFLLVAANLILFPLYEMNMDKQGDMNSIALTRGSRATSSIVWALLISHAVLLVVAVLWLPDFSIQGVTFASMNLILIMLLVNQSRFRKHQVYRVLGDGIFLLPILPILLV